jgi:hypothetical protein
MHQREYSVLSPVDLEYLSIYAQQCEPHENPVGALTSIYISKFNAWNEKAIMYKNFCRFPKIRIETDTAVRSELSDWYRDR